MTGYDQDQTTPSDLREAFSRVMALGHLPSLTPEAHRNASALIHTLLDASKDMSDFPVDFDRFCRVVSHLREIGDPTAAEELATLGAERLVDENNRDDATTLLNMAGLACFDQGLYDEAEHHFTRALDLIMIPDVKLQMPVILINQATVMTEVGRFEQALTLYERTLHVMDAAPSDSYGEIDSLLPEQVKGLVTNNIGWVLLRSARAAGWDRDLLIRATVAFDGAMALPLHPRTRIIARGNRAEVCIMSGDTSDVEQELAELESECSKAGYLRLLPEVYRRRAQLHAARDELEAAVEWSRRAMHASISGANPRQEIRIVEVFLDMLRGVVSRAPDPHAALEESGAQVVTQILSLLETKDTYTGGNHSRRVATLAHRIATQLVGEGPGQLRWAKRVELGGLFHDIGKLRIPWSLLNRVSRLSERDWALLKAHTTTGEAMLRDLGLWSLALVAGGHHERPDRKGYPRGAARTTLEAAIVAVADAFEAMTSPSRIYAEPKTPVEALREVRAGAGTQFHPEVADALITLFGGNGIHPDP